MDELLRKFIMNDWPHHLQQFGQLQGEVRVVLAVVLLIAGLVAKQLFWA